jgi:transmembrane sensor
MAEKLQREREVVIEQATDWLLANESDADASRDEFVAWLRASPAHVGEYLGVAGITRELHSACGELAPVADLIAQARAEQSDPLMAPAMHAPARVYAMPKYWAAFAACLTAAIVLGYFGYSALRSRDSATPVAREATVPPAPVMFATRHGQQLDAPLPDNSVLHLNTDSAVEVVYSSTERLVIVESGEASFEVAHEPQREFHVLARSAEVIARGTIFDVHLDHGTTLVTVVEGKVVVGPSAARRSGVAPDRAVATQFVPVQANQQVRVTDAGPGAPIAVDARRETAWVRHQIVFEHEPLERIASEMNRYSTIPIEIAPSLKSIQITGVFATDDTTSFIAFLRSLDGVTVDVSPTRILVSPKRALSPRPAPSESATSPKSL